MISPLSAFISRQGNIILLLALQLATCLHVLGTLWYPFYGASNKFHILLSTNASHLIIHLHFWSSLYRVSSACVCVCVYRLYVIILLYHNTCLSCFIRKFKLTCWILLQRLYIWTQVSSHCSRGGSLVGLTLWQKMFKYESPGWVTESDRWTLKDGQNWHSDWWVILMMLYWWVFSAGLVT